MSARFIFWLHETRTQLPCNIMTTNQGMQVVPEAEKGKEWFFSRSPWTHPWWHSECDLVILFLDFKRINFCCLKHQGDLLQQPQETVKMLIIKFVARRTYAVRWWGDVSYKKETPVFSSRGEFYALAQRHKRTIPQVQSCQEDLLFEDFWVCIYKENSIGSLRVPILPFRVLTLE